MRLTPFGLILLGGKYAGTGNRLDLNAAIAPLFGAQFALPESDRLHRRLFGTTDLLKGKKTRYPAVLINSTGAALPMVVQND